jgi:hypothetical protein
MSEFRIAAAALRCSLCAMADFLTRLGLASPDAIVAVGGDRLWLASGERGPVLSVAAYAAVQSDHRKTVAVGDEAKQMLGREPTNLRCASCA